ncbi:Conserved hypothetical protein; putative exported protein [Candidatus Glomeribacter gigasporarum BEG34]|uniref:LPS export ABC transporter periplasmic protein LptC n=1 Tax=Candidatus Glomeribacter gigasporarum BEG34 TaxID=1070319 RepID=G2JC49_9BURK|nr:LPS export ABC transporter periplasmic protein LptC [Candidatus Glomeribacter gigasporarum]CCD30357.1 Conserved hypothetical protein; putative exported protein [Candidatus Glomeribacter gigasporarum BEG34]
MQRTPLTQWCLLGFAALCAGLSYWIAQRAPGPAQRASSSQLKGRYPDAFADQASMTLLDQNGAAQYQMHAVKFFHYPDQDATEMYSPALRAFTPGQPEITSTAMRGVIRHQQTIVDLYGRARIARARSRNAPEMEARSAHFRIFADKDGVNRVQTEQPVQLRRGKSVVNADRMHYDHITRVIDLQGHVRGNLYNFRY